MVSLVITAPRVMAHNEPPRHVGAGFHGTLCCGHVIRPLPFLRVVVPTCKGGKSSLQLSRRDGSWVRCPGLSTPQSRGRERAQPLTQRASGAGNEPCSAFPGRRGWRRAETSGLHGREIQRVLHHLFSFQCKCNFTHVFRYFLLYILVFS